MALTLGEPCSAKVGICHRTGATTNPYVHVEVCADAVPAHAAHGDLVACPENQVIDRNSCTCVCDPTIDCGDEVLNPETCECVPCLPGFTLVPVPCSSETASLCCSRSCSGHEFPGGEIGLMCCDIQDGTAIC